MPTALTLAVSIVALGWPGPAEPKAPATVNETAADLVTLRDGKVVSGEWIDPAPKTPGGFYVRRDWARSHLPEWTDRWEASEAPVVKRARAQRRTRLQAWKRERSAANEAGKDDRVSNWIDRELTNADDPNAARSALLLVKPSHNDIRNVVRAPKDASRLLRLGWLSHFPEPETMKIADLKDALEGRGYDLSSKTPVSIEALAPLQLENDATWAIRRAATEVLNDPGLKFVRHQGLLLPEPDAGQPINPLGALGGGLEALKGLLGETPVDPLPAKLREIAARGRTGAVVTSLEITPDMSSVNVAMSLWVRHANDRWAIAGTRSARIRPADLDAEPGKDLADDPQVATAFKFIESLGLGDIAPELKQQSLGIGAATQKALGQARSLAQADLATFAFSVTDAPAP